MLLGFPLKQNQNGARIAFAAQKLAALAAGLLDILNYLLAVLDVFVAPRGIDGLEADFANHFKPPSFSSANSHPRASRKRSHS